MYYVVKYEGPFGFIKPWTAVRDQLTFSQQFLTPSIIEGIEKKLFPELLSEEIKGIKKIMRHRINYSGLEEQQERTWSKGGFSFNKEKETYKTNMGIIKRGVMINPHLYLAFGNKEDADRAFEQSVCLCRNEDILLPIEKRDINENEFDLIDGFELVIADSGNGFLVGFNRFNDAAAMFGELKVHGSPLRRE